MLIIIFKKQILRVLWCSRFNVSNSNMDIIIVIIAVAFTVHILTCCLTSGLMDQTQQRISITTNVCPADYVLQEQITVAKKTDREVSATHIELPTSEATPFPVACGAASSVEASAGALWT